MDEDVEGSLHDGEEQTWRSRFDYQRRRLWSLCEKERDEEKKLSMV